MGVEAARGVGSLFRRPLGDPVTPGSSDRVDHAVEPRRRRVKVPAPALLPGEGLGRGWPRFLIQVEIEARRWDYRLGKSASVVL
jgi:hypothetical protein